MCSLAERGAGSRNHVCMIKSWLPPEGSQHKVKEIGLRLKPNNSQLFFFFLTTYRLSRAAWNRACWKWGSPDTRRFLHGLFCPQNLHIVFFLDPFVNQKKRKEKGWVLSLGKCPVTEE